MVIDLVEWQPYALSPTEATDALLDALGARKEAVLVFRRGAGLAGVWTLTVPNVVGQIRVGRDCLLRMAPKVAVSNIFAMLELAYQLESFRFETGVVSVESIADIYDRLANILALRVISRVRRGLHAEYIPRSERLGSVRGRIDLRESARLIANGIPALQCDFEEHTDDIEDNQILAWTLRLLTMAGLDRADVRDRVNAAYRAIAGACTLRHFKGQDCVARRYNRLNQDYRAMHGLCRFFLENLGPGVASGNQSLMPYTVNMPLLFESFVVGWLQQHGPAGYDFVKQHQLSLQGTIKPNWAVDILVKDSTGRPIAVMDTKYKQDSTPSSDDLQQISAYALATGVEQAFIVYPSAIGSGHRQYVGNVLVKTVHFDIGGELQIAGCNLLAQLGLPASAMVD